MMYGFGPGYGMGFGFGGIGMFLFWILLIVIAVIAIRQFTPARRAEGLPWQHRSAVDILRERYARGEIDKEEFDRRRRDLET